MMKTVIVPQIPIFITARGNNADVVKQNKEALKYSYILIKEMNMFDQTYIISDNNDMLEYAKLIGFSNFIYQECETEYEINYLDYIAIYNFYLKTGYKPDWFILLSIGQLFPNKTLLYDCIRHIDDNYDVIASYTEISNKSAYFIKNDKIISSGHLVTQEKDRQKMIDAAIYAIKTDFAINCMETVGEDPAAVFWSGKIKYFENNSVYTDISSINDIDKYKHVKHILEEIEILDKRLLN